MKCKILHEARGQMRVHLLCTRMTLDQADLLEYSMRTVKGVTDAQVFDRTQDAVIRYSGARSTVTEALASFSFARAAEMDLVPERTARRLNREYEDKLVMTVFRRVFSKLYLPMPVRAALSLVRSVRYIRAGLHALFHGKLTVAVLDATAVSASLLRGVFSTAGSGMFLL